MKCSARLVSLKHATATRCSTGQIALPEGGVAAFLILPTAAVLLLDGWVVGLRALPAAAATANISVLRVSSPKCSYRRFHWLLAAEAWVGL